MASSTLICETEQWKELKVIGKILLRYAYCRNIVKHSIKRISFVQAHVADIRETHLRDLLSDDKRSRSMMVYVTSWSHIILWSVIFLLVVVTIERGDYHSQDLEIFGVKKLSEHQCAFIVMYNLLTFTFFEVSLMGFYWTTQGSRPPLKQWKNSSNWQRSVHSF